MSKRMLGYQQKMVFWEILNSREYGISIEDALNLRGSAKDWASSYHRSMENAISRHNSEHNDEPCAPNCPLGPEQIETVPGTDKYRTAFWQNGISEASGMSKAAVRRLDITDKKQLWVASNAPSSDPIKIKDAFENWPGIRASCSLALIRKNHDLDTSLKIAEELVDAYGNRMVDKASICEAIGQRKPSLTRKEWRILFAHPDIFYSPHLWSEISFNKASIQTVPRTRQFLAQIQYILDSSGSIPEFSIERIIRGLITTGSDDIDRITSIFSKSKSGRIHMILADFVDPHAKLSEKTLTILMRSSSYSFHRIVASNIYSTPEMLEQMATSKTILVRSAVGANPSAPATVLAKLLKSSSKAIKRSVGSNPNAPVELLERLANDSDESVRKAVGTNPSAPEYIKVYVAL